MNIKEFNNICSTLKEIISGSIFENHVFCVGGCCRDEILGYEIKDIDIAVDLPNGGIDFANWLFENKFLSRIPVTYPTYSTAQFHLSKFPDLELEAVQTRKEKYEDKSNRNPTTAYGSIKEDCLRRDLTINSLYKNVSTGEFLDITGFGFQDIKDKVIRTPVNPDETFDDDPLRMLRCIRFASRYNWNISNETWNGIIKNVDRLEIITRERVCDEFNKMLKCNHLSYAISMLYESGLYKHIIGDIGCDSQYKKIISTIDRLDTNDYLLRISYILLNVIDSPDDVISIMMKLKYSNNEIKTVHKYVSIVNDWNLYIKDEHIDKWSRKQQYICKTKEVFDNCLKLFALDSCKPEITYHLKRNEDCCFFNYVLPVNGNDVMNILDIKPGPKIKECLDKLLDFVFLYPEFANNKDYLINQLKIIQRN